MLVIEELEAADLDSMQITLPGHRKTLLLAAKKLKSGEANAPAKETPHKHLPADDAHRPESGVEDREAAKLRKKEEDRLRREEQKKLKEEEEQHKQLEAIEEEKKLAEAKKKEAEAKKEEEKKKQQAEEAKKNRERLMREAIAKEKESESFSIFGSVKKVFGLPER